MRKFKFMSKFAVGVMAAAMTMGSLSGAVAHTPVAVYAAGGDEQKTAVPTRVVANADKVIVKLGESTDCSAEVYDQDEELIASPTVTWSVTGAAKTDTKIDTAGKLTVAKDETAKELTITAKCGSAEGTTTILIGTGVYFQPSYGTMTASLDTNGDDTFFFLEVLKDEKGEKQGTIYCYEEGDADKIDLSFLKISKPVYLRVYGNKNTTPLKIYTLAAQEKKPTVKYVAGQQDFYKSFQLNKADLTAETVETLQWKTQYDESWKGFKSLEGYMDSLEVAGSTILVRKISPDWDKPATTEVKVKIAASPKAPKVTVDYAKNTIKLAKDTEIRVPDWDEIPEEVKDSKGEVIKVNLTPFYYQVNKEKLSLSPADLAKELVTEYIARYNEYQGKLSEANKKVYLAKSTESEKDGDGNVTKASDKDTMLKEMKENGYSFLIRTKEGKKAASQPTFVDVKAAPVIGIRQKDSGEKDKDGNAIMVPENVIAITTWETKTTGTEPNVKEETVAVYGDSLEFEWKEQTGKMKEAELVLTPDSKNETTTFSYSLDDGKKWNPIKKATSIGVSKTKDGVIVRAEGTKEDKKKKIEGAWASESFTVPVAVSEIKVKGVAEITAKTDAAVTQTYSVESIKDFNGNTVTLGKDEAATLSATVGTTKATFDEKTGVLTVPQDAVAGEVVIKASYGGAEGTLTVKINAAPSTGGATE